MQGEGVPYRTLSSFSYSLHHLRALILRDGYHSSMRSSHIAYCPIYYAYHMRVPSHDRPLPLMLSPFTSFSPLKLVAHELLRLLRLRLVHLPLAPNICPPHREAFSLQIDYDKL